jgi:hypothetical protein
LHRLAGGNWDRHPGFLAPGTNRPPVGKTGPTFEPPNAPKGDSPGEREQRFASRESSDAAFVIAVARLFTEKDTPQPGVSVSPKRSERFSLSPGERAGVRASVRTVFPAQGPPRLVRSTEYHGKPVVCVKFSKLIMINCWVKRGGAEMLQQRAHQASTLCCSCENSSFFILPSAFSLQSLAFCILHSAFCLKSLSLRHLPSSIFHLRRSSAPLCLLLSDYFFPANSLSHPGPGLGDGPGKVYGKSVRSSGTSSVKICVKSFPA